MSLLQPAKTDFHAPGLAASRAGLVAALRACLPAIASCRTGAPEANPIFTNEPHAR